MNKLKTLSIAICCLVSALLSEVQCMQEGNAIENVVGNARHAANFDIGEAIAMLRSELDEVKRENSYLRERLNQVDQSPKGVFVTFDGPGNILNSFGVSQVTKNVGDGDYTITFSNPFDSENYCSVLSARGNNANLMVTEYCHTPRVKESFRLATFAIHTWTGTTPSRVSAYFYGTQ